MIIEGEKLSILESVESGLLPGDVDGDHTPGPGASDAWAWRSCWPSCAPSSTSSACSGTRFLSVVL